MSSQLSHVTTIPAQRPPFEIPRAPPPTWSPDTVIPYVKTGMMIELSTIPLYLYSMYSIHLDNGGVGTQARAALRGVVQQEMLHLSLTGNLLCALGGSMDLYNYDIIPRYPGHILVEKIDMNLDRANKENLECFLQIEAPDTPRPPPDNNEPGLLPDKQYIQAMKARKDIAPTYKSIGDFYEDLQKGLKKLPDSDFAHNSDRQLSGMDFFGDQMVVITDQLTALNALTTIIEQGEGNIAVPDSHYSVFVKLYLNREAWKMYKVPKNPQTKDYKGHSRHLPGPNTDYAYKLSLAFDAGYCYLLQTMQRVWHTGRGEDEVVLRLLLLGNIHAIMSNVMAPLAGILVHQMLDYGGLVAAPCFNYYPLDDNGRPQAPLDPVELHSQLVARVEDAYRAAPMLPVDVKNSLRQMADYIRDKIPPK